MDLAVIGGSGAQGLGLGARLAIAGHRIVIGSRSPERGSDAAARLRELAGGDVSVEGTTNQEAAAEGEVVLVTVPFAGQAEIYRSIAREVPTGTVVVDATSPLATAVGGRAWQTLRPWHGSAAEQAKALLPDGVRVVAAFHTIAAEALQAVDRPMDSDVFVCGDDAAAKATVGELVEDIQDLRWIDAGPLSMARVAEQLTALLVSVNRTYKVRESGFRLTGRGTWGPPEG